MQKEKRNRPDLPGRRNKTAQRIIEENLEPESKQLKELDDLYFHLLELSKN
ncbi:MAG: hypothetical protein KKA81_01140 [Bacteroidetes bacterium]|nr:hypothetical protein [Bacteroidota bacterium]